MPCSTPHAFSRLVHGRASCDLFIFQRLRRFLERPSTITASPRVAGPAWTARSIRVILEFLRQTGHSGAICATSKFHVPSESVVGDVTVPGCYLHSAFVVQSGSNEDDVWIADSGASCHMTHDRTRMYNMRPPRPGRETITIGDRRRIKVEYIGNMDVNFHGKSDQRITLIDVAYVPDLGFKLYSLHAIQKTHLIVLDASGTHIIGANLTFPRSSSGSYLLPAGTAGARRRQGDMRATNVLRQLRHSIPPPSQEIPPAETCARLICKIQLFRELLQYWNRPPFPLTVLCWGKFSSWGKTPPRPACKIGTPLAAASLTPGPLKHGKEVDISHLHVPLPTPMRMC